MADEVQVFDDYPPNPYDDPELYESIVLGGVKSPGQVTLSGHNRVVTWDVKSGSGVDGATTTLKEIPPISFTASFYLVDDYLTDEDQFGDWSDFAELIDSTVEGKTPKALDVYHPDLARNDIKSVCKGEISGVVHDGKGGQTITVKFQEYRPPRPKGGTPSGSKTTAKTENDPNSAAKSEIDRLTKQYQDTPWQ